MATTTVKSNRQSYYPPISPNPTAAQMALHLKDLYTAINNHDEAITLLDSKVGTPTSSSTSGSSTSTLVTKTIVVSQLPGLGGVNDSTGLTAYTPTAADNGIFLLLGDASPVAVTLDSAMVTPYIFFATNYNSGVVTFTPSSGSINGAASWVLPQGGLFLIGFDGVNWKTSDILVLAQTFTAVTHEFLTAYNAATGLFTAAQPNFTDIAGTATVLQGGTGATTASGARTNLAAAASGINSDITSLTGITTPLAVSEGGTGTATPSIIAGTGISVSGSWPNQTIAESAPTLSGTSGSLGGSAMTAGQTVTIAVTVAGATTSMVATASPVTYPGASFVWDAYVSAANTVTVCLTAVLAGTPTASAYNVRIIP